MVDIAIDAVSEVGPGMAPSAMRWEIFSTFSVPFALLLHHQAASARERRGAATRPPRAGRPSAYMPCLGLAWLGEKGRWMCLIRLLGLDRGYIYIYIYSSGVWFGAARRRVFTRDWTACSKIC